MELIEYRVPLLALLLFGRNHLFRQCSLQKLIADSVLKKDALLAGLVISQRGAMLELHEFPRFNVYDLSAGIMFLNLLGKPIFGWGTAMSQYNYFRGDLVYEL